MSWGRSSAVLFLSLFVRRYFRLLLQNNWVNFKKTWHETIFGNRGCTIIWNQLTWKACMEASSDSVCSSLFKSWSWGYSQWSNLYIGIFFLKTNWLENLKFVWTFVQIQGKSWATRVFFFLHENRNNRLLMQTADEVITKYLNLTI